MTGACVIVLPLLIVYRSAVDIPLPEAVGRRQLFQINLERVDVAPDVDFDVLVAETEGYSGDDICGLCETAKMMPVKRLYTPELLKELQRKRQEGATDEELQTYEKAALEITWVSRSSRGISTTLADWLDVG